MGIWDAYDCKGNKTGAVLARGSSISIGLFHVVCETLVRHADGSYLLMQRDTGKAECPGIFEASAGGSALQGETPPACARRELREETGIAVGAFTSLYRQVELLGQTVYYGYLCITDWPKDQIVLQAGETIAYRWISRVQLLEFFASDACIPRQRERLHAYLQQL